MALIIVVVLQMLDRAEKQAERIRSIKVAGAQGSGNEFKESESNRLAKELVAKNLNIRKNSLLSS
jgi:adenylosuccinate lyase